jgi:hypothetical protein
MTDEKLHASFTEAVESITSVVLGEIDLINQDAKLQTALPQEEFVAKERENFLGSVRLSLNRVISDIADVSQDRWERVETAFPEQFPATPLKQSQTPGSDAGTQTVLKKQCPPGFEEEGGICVPIRGS